MRDLHLLPPVRDSWSYLYVEHCRIDQHRKAVAIHDANGMVAVPCASLSLLMLGPGTTITHAAVRVLADCGCLVAWTGEGAIRLYAQGLGKTRNARNLMRQATLWANPLAHLQVVGRMYQARFDEPIDPSWTLKQIRGREGARVRDTYARVSRETGVPWDGRSYRRNSWSDASPINRALSAANSCLYGVCHAAIVASGYSAALGFIHTGKMLSFVYDVADLYKTEITVPAAFRAVASSGEKPETAVRHACRDAFMETRLLNRIVSDIQHVLDVSDSQTDTNLDYEDDAALPGGLWDPGEHVVMCGQNFFDEEGVGSGNPDS